MTATGAIAANLSLVGCHACDLLVRIPPHSGRRHFRCPRCGARLHQRTSDGTSRAWAFLIAASILYLPANLYPVMTVVYFGRGTPDTIMSGVIQLYHSGQWPIAALVFFASIFVPIVKLAVLAFLLITVQGRSQWRPRERTVLYRFIETIGRWSMIDIFMISILVALVQLGAIANIEPGPGAACFAAVVVLTMFAAMSFDPRLIWDNAERET